MLVREKFDPLRTYVANKVFSWGGDKYAPGQVFPRALAGERRLRQMYENRFLRMAPDGARDPGDPDPAAQGKPVMPHFAELSMRGLQQWLVNNGMQIEGEPDKDELVVMAQQLWQSLQTPAPGTGMTRYEQAAAEIGGLVSKDFDPSMPVKLDIPENKPRRNDDNGVATTDGDREHSGQRLQGPVDDGDTPQGDRDRAEQSRRSDRPRGRNLRGRRHQG